MFKFVSRPQFSALLGITYAHLYQCEKVEQIGLDGPQK
jgi:hypothetical protein